MNDAAKQYKKKAKRQAKQSAARGAQAPRVNDTVNPSGAGFSGTPQKRTAIIMEAVEHLQSTLTEYTGQTRFSLGLAHDAVLARQRLAKLRDTLLTEDPESQTGRWLAAFLDNPEARKIGPKATSWASLIDGEASGIFNAILDCVSGNDNRFGEVDTRKACVDLAVNNHSHMIALIGNGGTGQAVLS